MTLVSRTIRLWRGFAPGLPRGGNLRIDSFAGKLVETGLSGASQHF